MSLKKLTVLIKYPLNRKIIGKIIFVSYENLESENRY